VGPWLNFDQVSRVLACGMVGAKQGWQEAPYEAVPCKPASNIIEVKAKDPRIRVFIVGGICQLDPPDVMRGEETQILGFLADRPDWTGTLCLPGSHNKWVEIRSGALTSFKSVMTGEVYAALCNHTVLRHSTRCEVWDSEAFERALLLSLRKPEAGFCELFTARSQGLLETTSPGFGHSYLSGLLIGLELSGTRHYWTGTQVEILGNDFLSHRYCDALKMVGATARCLNVTEITLSGLRLVQNKVLQEFSGAKISQISNL
jgi:2-dehydro-3-deoxygalactonokinase